MGIPFFTTFINNYLFANKDPYKSINLTGENFIIDGYSLFYFIYYMLQNEDKNTTITERITGRKFANDGLSEKFRSILKEFKDKCKNVYVVFDGAFGLNTHRRPDPKRDSTIQFDNSHSRLSPLLNDQLKHILRELKIEVQVADGEADPLIVQMAKKHNAYIVARDSDYFLYVAPKGYVPLDTLAFSTLDGKYYYMHDVFQNMTPQCVALWGTTITYNFISFNDLQVTIHFLSLNKMS